MTQFLQKKHWLMDCEVNRLRLCEGGTTVAISFLIMRLPHFTKKSKIRSDK